MKTQYANETIEANIYVHSSLAKSGEYQKSPHFYPENKEKVRKNILRCIDMLPNLTNRKIIDFGCGTGFIIDLVCDLFEEVHGVDITQDMMQLVDLSPGNVFLHESLAENTHFKECTFDFATAYSFMDHLSSVKPFLLEAHRVLKNGGVLYCDLNPNRAFIEKMLEMERMNTNIENPIIKREIIGALHNGNYYEENFGLNASMLEKAEPIKTNQLGFDPNEIENLAKEIGFSKCITEHDWFLGQGLLIKQSSKEEITQIENYLKVILPYSSDLFKYLRFIFIK